MLRIFRETQNKPANTMNKAEVALATGMAVVEDATAKTVGLPTADAAVNLKFVTKERIATGYAAGAGDLSDYYEEFNTVKKDEMTKIYTFLPGDVFGTDQYASGLTPDTLVAAGTDGKLKTATSGVSTYKFIDFYDDAGHILAMVEVLHTAETV